LDAAPPSNIISDGDVYTSDATAIATLAGIYTNMSDPGGSGVGGFVGAYGISARCGLSADEFSLYTESLAPDLQAYFRNNLTANGSPATGSEIWTPLYNYIYRCNAAIEGITKSNDLSAPVKQQLLGEAKFLRSFFYFYLVNLFGDIPIITSTNYKMNTTLSRSVQSEVYQNIVSDLKDAEKLLSANYLNETIVATSTERVRPTKWAAKALLARVYLYLHEWTMSKTTASELINENGLFTLVPLNEVFLKNSLETIWQLQPTTLYFNTEDALSFIVPETGLSEINPLYLNQVLLNSFEPYDQRRKGGNWVDSVIVNGTIIYYPFKYKRNDQNPDITSPDVMSEYLTVFRLSEQYLIRAEANAELGDLQSAISDIDVIRVRAGLPALASTNPNISQSELINVIMHERQVELFGEWGHRWLDLKRTNHVDQVMQLVTPTKANGQSWRSFQKLYPLPQTDLEKAPNLTQNDGY
jgi:hypothetical protein